MGTTGGWADLHSKFNDDCEQLDIEPKLAVLITCLSAVPISRDAFSLGK